MKNVLIIAALFIGFFAIDASAQAIYSSGKIELTLRSYGRIRVGMVNADSVSYTRQLDRGSLLYYMSPTNVFDYLEDTDDIMEPDTVQTPEWGDFQIKARCNGDYAGKSPKLEEGIDVFGWDGKAYGIVRFTVLSLEQQPYDGRFGMEFIPQIDGTYGNEVMTYNQARQLFAFYKDSSFLGIKILNHPVASAHNFDWFEGYNVDSLLSIWMTDGQFENYLWAGIDGGTAVFGTTPITTNPADSVQLYIAVAVGKDSVSMNAAIDEATARYNAYTSVENEKQIASITDYALYQNYPNAFNPSTQISYDLPKATNVTLTVYNILGNKVAELVNGYNDAGRHTVNFDASKLSSGVYFYTLNAGGKIVTNKMILSK